MNAITSLICKMMRRLTIFIILLIHSGLFAQSPELIFNSGFEPSVDTFDHQTNDLDIIGIDNSVSVPNDWVNDLETHPNIGYFKIEFKGGTGIQRNAEIVVDPTDPTNKTLQFWVREVNSGNNGRVQANIYDSSNGITEMFYSVRLFIPDDFELLMNSNFSTDLLTLMEFWNNANWDDEDYMYRMNIDLKKNGSAPGPLKMKVTGQVRKPDNSGWGDDIWQVLNTAYVIPVEQWMTIKFYFVEGDDCTGRFIVSVTPDGGYETIVHNIRNYTHHPDNPSPDGLTDFNPFKLYAGDEIVEYFTNNGNGDMLNLYWDDFELWQYPVLPTADECLAGGVTFSMQSQIDDFASNYPDCKNISGDVTISGGSITSLSGLSQLTSIQGSLTIQSNTSLSSLNGLNNLTCVNGSLIIDSNSSLTSISALGDLRSLHGNLEISNNASLPNLTGLHHIAGINGSLTILNNEALTSLTGLENIKNTTFTNLVIQNNASLSFCELENICKYLQNSGPTTISGNASGCNTEAEVISACLSLLPVELTHFSGKESEGEVVLSWQTASEVNNDYFQVEHSTDGRVFKPLGIINGHGTTSEKNDYSFVHQQPGAGINYYRLKQVDFDGGYAYSDVIALAVAADGIVIRPNPTSSQVEIIGENLTGSFVKVMDSMGRMIYSLELTDSNTINLSDHPRGIYIFIIQTAGQSIVKRIVKN